MEAVRDVLGLGVPFTILYVNSAENIRVVSNLEELNLRKLVQKTASGLQAKTS